MIEEMLSLAAMVLPEEEIIEEIEKLCKEYKYSDKSKKSSTVNQILAFTHILTIKVSGHDNPAEILKLSGEIKEMKEVMKLIKPHQG